MSYILDALRKADAQRARDPARGIHAQPAVAPPASAASGRGRAQWIWGALAVLVLAVAGWLWSGGDKAVAPPAAPLAVARVEPAPLPTPAPAPPAAVVLPPPPPVVVVTPAAPVVAPQKAPPPASAAAPAPAPAPIAEHTYSLADLPPDVRQALPKFSVSGGVYSENVAQRMLIVNGQVFNEGSEIAPGVVLEQIRAKVAVLKFRGLRIAQPY